MLYINPSVSIPKRVSEALNQVILRSDINYDIVSIPKRVSEALNLRCAEMQGDRLTVSIPKRVSEALNPTTLSDN